MSATAYLGPEGSFTHQAAQELSSGGSLVAVKTAPEVVRAVEDGRAEAGVVAFENSLHGDVPGNLDELLAASRVVIAGEKVLPVTFALLRIPGDATPLQTVISHPFGLAQCAGYVAERSLRTLEASSTAEACRILAQEDLGPGHGAIGPEIAGRVFGLELAEPSVGLDAAAATRFLLLRRSCPGPSGRDHSAFVFRPRRDKPGSLVRLLQEFSGRGINLTAIRSRPTKELLGDYYFFIECEGHLADRVVGDAVRGLLTYPGEVRFLGSFPVDPGRVVSRRVPDLRVQVQFEAMQELVDLEGADQGTRPASPRG